jgi:adenine C2-methylase RlmN of 23S rRNA A2503 and tRNA A37
MDIKSQMQAELEAQFQAWEQPAYRVAQLLDWLYVQRVTNFDAMTNLPKALREKLRAQYSLHALELVRKQGARDTTQKFLWKLADGQFIESVLIPANPALVRRGQRPAHALRLHAGGLRLRLQVLRERIGRLETQSHSE